MATHDSSSNSGNLTYQVFLSFRGPDTRKTFIHNLYPALNCMGSITFRDTDELEWGKDIMTQLKSAIKNSEMSVVVFSENYASSNACLQEVTAILEHSRTWSGHTILPIFYHVEPSDLKKKAKELKITNSTEERQEAWSDALIEVSKMAGMHLKDQNEADFIQDIVERVGDKLTPMARNDDTHLIGMEARVKKVEMWLRADNLTDLDGIFVIRGMSGVGKTTAARFVYQKNRARFDASCFLENIRAASQKPNFKSKLQRKLLRELVNKKVDKTWDSDKIMTSIKYASKKKRILMVLDDVDEVEQSNAILSIQNLLTRGSKVIVTTTREDLTIKQVGIYNEHRIEKLDEDESLELFSWHAFGQSYPNVELKEMSKKYVQYCQGHPLALKVLAASVSGKSLEIWVRTLESLEERLDANVVKKLEVGYNSLKLVSDQSLFRDVACFFVGKKKNKTITILDGCGYQTTLGIEKLVDRNLLTFEEGRLKMHQLLQDMAKQLIIQESIYPEERSRIWRSKESFHILTSHNGTAKIEGLALDMSMMKKSNVETTNVRNTWRSYFRRSYDEEVLDTAGLEKMSKLRLLKLNELQLIGGYNVFPANLRWLSWRRINLKSLPSDFPPKGIVSLDLRNSSLEQAWKETKALGSLKYLNLSYSSKLTRTPNFSRIPSLEKLLFKGCTSLVAVDESIVFLDRLNSLNLKGCINLRKLPNNFSLLKSLEELNISGCSSLEGASDNLKKMELKELYADRTVLHKLLNSNLNESQYRFNLLRVAKRPRRNPEISWSSLPISLVTLSMRACNLSEDDFPKSFGHLPMLRNLNLGENFISRLPDCIRDLNLNVLDLSWSPRLLEILWPSTNVEQLIVTECRQLEQITYESSIRPKSISHGACMNLNYVKHGFLIQPVQNVDVSRLNYVGFFHLESMANFEVTIVNCIVWSKKKLPIQVLFEAYILSTYYPGNEVPTWFSNKAVGSKISFTVPSTSSPIRGMNMCIVYTHPPGIIDMSIPICVYIKNISKGLEEKYKPRYYGIPEENGETIVWLSHWIEEICVSLFEECNEIEISIDLDVAGEVKECGIHFLHHINAEEGEDHMSS